MADPKQKSSLTLAQIDEALKRILGGLIASVNGINTNQLDNWDFSNPVNQKRGTEYTGAVYGIDRWIGSSACKVALGDGVIQLSFGGTAHQLIQYLGNSDKLCGKTVTLSAVVDGILRSTTIAVPKSVSSGTIGAGAFFDNGIGLYLRSSNGRLYVSFYGSSSYQINAVVNVLAVKLELGSVQTLAHQDENGNWVLNEIPDYGKMLLKCQRYYQLFSSADARPSDLADYRPNMRANPALGTIVINEKTYYFSDSSL